MTKKRFGEREEREELGWMSGLFTRKRRSSPQQQVTTPNEPKDPPLLRRNKAKNLHLFLSDIMRKLKHSFKKEKSQHDNRLSSGKKRRFQRSLSSKDHFFLERMTSVSPERSHQGYYKSTEKHLSEMFNNEDFDRNLATSKEAECASPFSSTGRRIWDHDSTLLSTSNSDDFIKSETVAATKDMEVASSSESNSLFAFTSTQFVEAYDGEREGEILKETSHEESLPQLSRLSVASQSQYLSKIEEYIEYEISPARGEAKRQPFCNQLEERNHTMDEKELVFKYVKAVLDAIDSDWEEVYLKTEYCDQLLNPALISNIPFYPNQLGIDHELVFDCINEVLFELCSFPSSVVDNVISKVQKEVTGHLFPLQLAQSVDQIVGEDMANPRNWLDSRCDLECIGLEASEMVLNELVEQLMLDL